MISKSEIKFVRSLKLKKFRQKYNLFVAEGERIIETILNHGSLSLHRLYVSPQWSDKIPAGMPSAKICHTEASYIKQASLLATPAPVMGIFEIPEWPISLLQEIPKVLFVDDIQDPGNLGTIIRIADWYGINAVVRSTGSADFYSPKVVQATMGSLGHVACFTLDRERFGEVFSTHLKVGSIVTNDGHTPIKPTSKICLVIGNEGRGISPEITDVLNQVICIQGAKNKVAESLNAGVATGILCQMIFGPEL